MKTFNEQLALKRLTELSELLDQTDSGDEYYDVIREEKYQLETALINPLINLNEEIKKTNFSSGIKGKAVGIVAAPRLTKVYFDKDINEYQAKGFGMHRDKATDDWYIKAWDDNVKVTDLDRYLERKTIPFKWTRYAAYGGRKVN